MTDRRTDGGQNYDSISNSVSNDAHQKLLEDFVSRMKLNSALEDQSYIFMQCQQLQALGTELIPVS